MMHNCAIQIIADAVASLQLEDIPDEALNHAKRSMIDVCGVTLAGAKTESARAFCDTAFETYGSGYCSVLGNSGKLNAPGAAFANGASAHVLDFDDNCYAGIVHASAVVFPAALAIAQQYNATGADLLLGFLTGLEVEFAVAKGLSNTIYDNGWWTTSVLGAIGSAACAAKIAKLDRDGIGHALALASVGTGATRAVRGTKAKHYYCGRAAESGVMAALAAMRNTTGPINMFEDQFGIPNMLNDNAFDTKAILALGVDFGVIEPGIDIKKYPVCYASHAAVDATREIMHLNGLKANDVESVVCTVPPIVVSNLTYHSPQTPVEAQFSLEFAIATIIEFGELTLGHLEIDVLKSVQIQQLINRIDLRVGDIPKRFRDVDNICPEWGFIELITKCGSRKLAFAGSPVGSALRPMSDEMLETKFNACIQYHDTESPPNDFYDRMRNIEHLEHSRDLFCNSDVQLTN